MWRMPRGAGMPFQSAGQEVLDSAWSSRDCFRRGTARPREGGTVGFVGKCAPCPPKYTPQLATVGVGNQSQWVLRGHICVQHIELSDSYSRLWPACEVMCPHCCRYEGSQGHLWRISHWIEAMRSGHWVQLCIELVGDLVRHQIRVLPLDILVWGSAQERRNLHVSQAPWVILKGLVILKSDCHKWARRPLQHISTLSFSKPVYIPQTVQLLNRVDKPFLWKAS